VDSENSYQRGNILSKDEDFSLLGAFSTRTLKNQSKANLSKWRSPRVATVTVRRIE
jgi:hypothetical protein